MKSRYPIVASIGLVLLVAYQLVPFEPSAADLAAIRRVVARRTSNAIMGVESLPSGAVEVKTGWVKGPLNGDGDFFRLRKVFGVWWVYSESHWAA